MDRDLIALTRQNAVSGALILRSLGFARRARAARARGVLAP
jgi:hypothetical protein